MKRYRLFQASPLWRYISYGVALLVLVPIFTVVTSWLLPHHEHWDHIAEHLLARLVQNSFFLLSGVMLGTSILGVSLAWLVSQYQFPGRSFFAKVLLLPIAIPAYVTGFVYLGLFEYSGPFATFLRGHFGSSWSMPDIRSYGGVVFVLCLALYPYVYLIVKNAFETQGRQIIEVGRSLGKSMPEVFRKLAIPLALPWLLGALSLVGMETLADFGTVSIFVYDTFTTAIYKAWYGFFSPTTAAQLASLLLIPISLFYFLERWLKKRTRYETTNHPAHRLPLKGAQGILASLFCGSVFTVGFLVPLSQLLVWAFGVAVHSDFQQIFGLAGNSITLAATTALILCVLSLILIYAYRFFRIPKLLFANRIASLGYALPGSVLAIGVFLPLAWLDDLIANHLEKWFGLKVGLWLTGGIFAMLVGLSIRFLAVAHAALYSGQQRVSPRLDEAAINHGVYGVQQLRRLHLPLMKGPLITAFILVFVDVIKEMPLTLMTRPFGWNTLSVKIFEFISEGQWQDASIPALFMILVSLIPVLILDRDRRTQHVERGA